MRCRRNIFVAIFLVIAGWRSAEATPKYGVALTIYYQAPEIRAYVSDVTNAESGADPNFSMDATGQQWNGGVYHSIDEIFNSNVVQKFLAGESRTLWKVNLRQPVGTYVLNYSTSLPSNFSDIRISFSDGTTGYRPADKNFALLAQNGVYRRVKIRVSGWPGISVTPLISSETFLKDTRFALSNGDLSPVGIGIALTDSASEIVLLSDSGMGRAETDELRRYLRVLERLQHRSQTRNAAYAALKLDAETLLKAIR